MSRNLLAIASLTSITALAVFTAPAARATDSIPSYFFNDWTIDTNCVEAGHDADDHAHQGLKFRISQASLSSGDQSYALETINNGAQVWDSSWALRLQYRAGTQMTAVPADFACVPGEEASSPLLAMTGFSQSTEPYYEYEHWYGLATIHGAPHHVLIFPRSATGDSSVVMVLENATADSVQLDQNGTIHGHTH